MSLRSITAPLRTKSENAYRGTNPWAGIATTKRQRADVATILTQLPRRNSDATSTFMVTLTRLSYGELDDDNLRGAFKAIRDEVARWLRVDDGDKRRVSWVYAQEPCARGSFGIRIAIHDGLEGAPYVRELMGVPAHAKARKAQTMPAVVKPAASQTAIVFRPCLAIMPWAPEIVEHLAMRGSHDPPTKIRVTVPTSTLADGSSMQYRPGSTIELVRSLAKVEDRECWLYRQR